MSHDPKPAAAPAAPVESTNGHDRWQGPSFAASWISPPSPQRSYADDASAPQREDDHA